MTFNLDPGVLIPAGRASVERAETLRATAASVDLGDTDIDDAAAREALTRRIRRLSARLRANGTELQAFVQDAAEIDSQVGFAFVLIQARTWR